MLRARVSSRPRSRPRRARALATGERFAAVDAPGGPLARARVLATRIQARQRNRQAAARTKARSDSRRALVLMIAAGGLALVAALLLITAIVAGLRRPLAELVAATRELAAGRLGRRVRPAGPRELRELGSAFNAMAERLRAAHGDSTEHEAGAAGADLYLTKPFSPLDLLRLVDRVGRQPR